MTRRTCDLLSGVTPEEAAAYHDDVMRDAQQLAPIANAVHGSGRFTQPMLDLINRIVSRSTAHVDDD